MANACFRVSGEYVTNSTRQKYYLDDSITYDDAVDILLNCLVTDQLTYDERLSYAKGILNGEYKIVGISGNDDYGIEEMTDADKREFKKWLKECPDGYKKYISNSKKSGYKEIDMTGAFDASPIRTKNKLGWLSPDGTFYVVDYGSHQVFAENLIFDDAESGGELSRSFNEYYKNKKELCKWKDSYAIAADFLVEIGWVLIDDPSRYNVSITRNKTKRLTKPQKEFLFDYLYSIGRSSEAISIYEE